MIYRIALAVLAFSIVPSVLAGQACLGLPSSPGQLAIQGIYDSGEIDTGYGARAVAFLPWSVAIGASYTRDDNSVLDRVGNTLGGTLAVELPFWASSLCLITEPSVSSMEWPEGFGVPAADVTTVRIPILAGAGQRLDFSGFYLVPSARGGLTHLRTTAEQVSGTTTESSATEVMIDASLAAGAGNVFATVGMNVISGQDTRPRFQIGVGGMLP